MDIQKFEIIKAIVTVVFMLISFYFVPTINTWIKTKLSAEQRTELLYWVKVGVQFAEKIYKERGQGALKKQEVLKYLNDLGLNFTEAQMGVLIDMVVKEFNKLGWEQI